MLKKMLILPVLAVALQSLSAAQSPRPVSAPEQAMASFIDANQQASNELLARLVNINSGTHNLEGVRAVAAIVKSDLTELGLKVDLIPMDQVQRAGVLIADHPSPEPGKCGKRMLLIGHMDTVFEKSSTFQNY